MSLVAWEGVEGSATSRVVQVFSPQFERQITLAGVNGDISRGTRPYAWLPDGWDHEDVLERRFVPVTASFLSEAACP